MHSHSIIWYFHPEYMTHYTWMVAYASGGEMRPMHGQVSPTVIISFARLRHIFYFHFKGTMIDVHNHQPHDKCKRKFTPHDLHVFWNFRRAYINNQCMWFLKNIQSMFNTFAPTVKNIQETIKQ